MSRRIRLVIIGGGIGILLILVIFFLWKYNQVRLAILKIEEHSGWVSEMNSPPNGPIEVSFFIPGIGSKMNDQAFQDVLPYLMNLPNLRNLSLAGSQITDRGIQGISSLPSLKILDLSSTMISNDSIYELSKLYELDMLILKDSRINDIGIAQLRTTLPNTNIIVKGKSVPQIFEEIKEKSSLGSGSQNVVPTKNEPEK